MANKLYKEKQRFNDKVAVVLLGTCIVGLLYATVDSLMADPANYSRAGLFFAVALALGGWLYWLVKLQLRVKISDKSIRFRMMTPFQSISRKIKWKEVQDCTIVTTPTLAQWHGGNISYGSESSFSLSGRNGLSVTTKDGQKYFIGSRDVDGLQKAMQSFSVG